ncbi:MAG: hypothetical protein KatS3mg109_1060 [Pirellulaceae bacterium]|nr:MAG: hypothetical protein KatS3mg109_1060 [Pirellulaceae bacterium]
MAIAKLRKLKEDKILGTLAALDLTVGNLVHPDDKLDRILQYHGSDRKVLWLIADYFTSIGRLQDALDVLTRLLDLNPDNARGLLLRAENLHRLRRGAEAYRDLQALLQKPDLDFWQLKKAVGLLREMDPSAVRHLIDVPRVRKCDAGELVTLFENLNWDDVGQLVFIELAEEALRRDDGSDRDNVAVLKHDLVLSYISVGRYADAIKIFDEKHEAIDTMPINDAFNYGMAVWARSGTAPRQAFERVLALQADLPRALDLADANFAQCISVSYWIVGERESALEALSEAERRLGLRSRSEFSCWRYKQVSMADFLADCAEIRRMICGEDIRPKFFREKPLGWGDLPISEARP